MNALSISLIFITDYIYIIYINENYYIKKVYPKMSDHILISILLHVKRTNSANLLFIELS